MYNYDELDKVELALLGVCLQHKEVFMNDALRLESSDFSHHFTRSIFETMTDIKDDIEEFDSALLATRLTTNVSSIDDEIAYSLIGQIIAHSGKKENAKKYISEILKESGLRKLKVKVDKIASDLNNGASLQDVTNQMNMVAMETQDRENSNFGASPSEFFKEHYERIMELKGKPLGHPTGWNDFDEMIGGIEAGTVTTFAARPSMGKTALGVNLAYNLSSNGVKTLFFSAEMDGSDISSRFIPFETKIGTKYNKDYDYLEKDSLRKELVVWGMEKLSKKPLTIDDSPALSIEDISYKLPLYAKQGYKVFIIDYIQFIQKRNKVGEGKEHEKIAYIMATLKTLAKKYRVAIVALAQIGRGIEQREKNDKSPKLSDMKGSSSIEENSDKVIAIHRPWFYLGFNSQADSLKKSNKIQALELIVLKNRNGAVGSINFWYFMDYNAFVERNEVDENGMKIQPPILTYEEYINKIVHPFRKQKETEMLKERNGYTQTETVDNSKDIIESIITEQVEIEAIKQVELESAEMEKQKQLEIQEAKKQAEIEAKELKEKELEEAKIKRKEREEKYQRKLEIIGADNFSDLLD